MVRWLVLFVLACGCRQIWGLGGTPAQSIDAGDAQDGPPDVAIDAQTCFGTFGDAPYCLDVLPTTAFSITRSTTFNASTNIACLPTFTAECVIAATDIDIDDQLAVIGSRPLVLIATGSLRVGTTGTLDVASHHNGNRGPASNPGACNNGNDPNSSGGGQGGSFGGAGGHGGNGQSSGGDPGSTIVPAMLQGGCPGQDGGSGGGANGNGGGAVYLIAEQQIEISGIVDASGSAGSGGPGNVRGGGGGGSGGMIVLESPSIAVVSSGSVYANGAGGGGGSALTAAGTAGEDPSFVTSAAGGQGGATAGDGGPGSAILMPVGANGNPTSGSDGGGGGGGGAGVLKTIGGTISNVLAVSPTPS